ncbi:MAG TPA: hypothetical protein VJ972_13170 [Anaerolineales bacterium]|nr:hypothetical protein [Anaerolineales bacterium]
MHTDLFLALLNRKNAREHPILSAMLYSFCPTAAHWWMVGADPVPPFDPLWQSLQDLVSGETLHECLLKYGFDGVIEEIRTYIREVEVYRGQHKNLSAPELLPFFRGSRISVEQRYGSQNAINNFGGDWRNLYVYVRTWAFLAQDWRIGMRIERDSNYTFKSEKVLLTLPFIRLPVQFDVWVWQVPVGHVMETKIGLLVSDQEQDQLRFSLMRRCNQMGKQPWPNTPTVSALDRETGKVSGFHPTLRDKDLERTVQSLSNLAKKGPYPPLHALRNPLVCKTCAYQHLCFERKSISQHAINCL